MKILNNLSVLVILISTISAMAQEPDSVTVTYENQKAVIPVPVFGSQTIIKLSDSIQTIEIAVSRIRPIDSLSITSESVAKNPKTKTKWFSQVYAGYSLGFVPTDPNDYPLAWGSKPNTEFIIYTEPLQGYKLGLSVYEKEPYYSRKVSLVWGLKFEFAQNFRKEMPKPEYQTGTNYQIGLNYWQSTRTRFELLLPVGFRYHIKTWKSAARINFGTSIGASIDYYNEKRDGEEIKGFSSNPLSLQPYLGLEYGKIGLLATVEFSLIPHPNLYINYSLGMCLSYRFF